MAILPAATIGLQLAQAPYTDMTVRGGCDGGYMVWDTSKREWRDWTAGNAERRTPNAESKANDATAHGVTYEAGLDACILNWLIVPRDIDTAEAGQTVGGLWDVVLPPGAPETTRWQQFDGDPGAVWAGPIRKRHEAGVPICVSLYREATPIDDNLTPPAPPSPQGNGGNDPAEGESADTLPWIYTAVEFGGRWKLVMPKWRPVELWKRTGGQWECVLRQTWQHATAYDDSHSGKELFVVVLNLEGVLLFKNSETEESLVYREAKPIHLPAAEVRISGNGGCAYLGYHDIAFSTDPDNYLYSRESWIARLAGTWPERRVIGSSDQAACSAILSLVNASGAVLPNQPGTIEAPVSVRYWRRLQLHTTDSRFTPVVRWAGVVYPSVPVAQTASWGDFSARARNLSGSMQIDMERRVAVQRYEVELENGDGALADWRGMRRARIVINLTPPPPSPPRGEGGTAQWGEGQTQGPARYIAGYMYVSGDTAENFGQATVKAQTLDRVETLFEIECGPRPPLDGMLVSAAIREVLSWGGVAASEIGSIYASGRRIPNSRFGAQQAFEQTAGVLKCDGGWDAEAVAQPAPEETVGSFYTRIAKFDCLTALVCDSEVWRYVNLLTVGNSHDYYEVETLDARDAMRGGFTASGNLRDRYTSVTVVGKDRVTGREIRATASLAAAISGTEGLGYDKGLTIRDENLNTSAMVAARCRWEYLKIVAGKRDISFECLAPGGRTIVDAVIPHESRTQGGTGQYIITAVADKVSEAEWTGQIDGMGAEAFGLEGA